MCASVPQHPKPVPRLEELSLDEKIGQLFVVPGHGVFMGESSPAYQELLHHVRDNHVGGVIWFVSNVYETALLNARLQAVARVPLLISADLESGIGMRFIDTTNWPPAMAVAATGDPLLAEEEGRIVAREAKAIGINQIFAPVADVNIDPDNPVINTRSFGEDPQDVGRYVAAFVRGVQSEQVLATAKHFPGHGDTHVDSHLALPVIHGSRERLERVELVPFRAAIAEHVASIMIGHLSVPSIDDTPAPVPERGHGENRYGTSAAEIPRDASIPATVSPKIINGLLRHDLGYTGLIVTDALDMGGLTEYFDAGEAAVRAIEAGQDQLLYSANTDVAIAAIKAAVANGRLSESRIDESVRRILAAKSFAPVSVADPGEIFRTIDAQPHRDVATTIARRAITLVRGQAGVLPLRREQRVLFVVVSDAPEVGNPLGNVERELRARQLQAPDVFMLDARSRDDEIAPILTAARHADVIILGLAVRAHSGAGQIAIPSAARTLVAQLGDQKPVIAIAFGSPYLLREMPTIRTYLCAYGPQPVMQSAALHAIFGDTPISGRLPVTIPGLYPMGHGETRR